MRGLSALLFVTACLSRPVGVAGDGGTSTDAGTDTNPLGVWPVPGVTIDRTLARDVDGDGTVDLVASSSEGIYVIAGGESFGASYQAFVPTPFAPLAFDVAAFGGATAPELAVLGLAGTTTRVLLFDGLGAFQFAAEGWRRDLVDLELSATESRGVWLLDSDGDGVGNVVAADNLSVVVGEPAAFSAQGVFEMPVLRAIGGNSGYFTYPDNVFVVPGAGTADLVIESFYVVSRFHGDGQDHYLAADREDIGGGPMYDVAAVADLDGDSVPEVVGGFGGFLGGASVVPLALLDYQGPGIINHPVVRSIAARFGELDNDPSMRPDLLMMRHIAASGAPTDTELVLVPNLVVTPGVVTTAAAVISRVLPGLSRAVEVGDFDHDGRQEIRIVAGDGSLSCFRAGDGTFDSC